MQKYGVIYKITNNINGKLYIGQTINFDRRLREHKLAKDNYPIHTAIRKYGWGNFTMEVIDEAYDRDELNKKELTPEQIDAVETCADYVRYSMFNGDEELRSFL